MFDSSLKISGLTEGRFIRIIGEAGGDLEIHSNDDIPVALFGGNGNVVVSSNNDLLSVTFEGIGDDPLAQQ